MEINFPGEEGLNTLKELTTQVPRAKVVIFTTATDFNLIDQALRSGASGYLLKEMDTVSLTKALKEVSQLIANILTIKPLYKDPAIS